MISGQGLLCVGSMLLLFPGRQSNGAPDCVWSQCSVSCGKGIQTGVGNNCTQPSTRKCSTSCNATHLANLGVTVTQHPQNTGRPSRPKGLMIDGMPTTVNGQSLFRGSTCASTNQGDNPWVRLDLKKAYLVSLVRVIIYGSTGENVVVRIGTSLTNNGNDNHQCGTVPVPDVYQTTRTAFWRDVACSPPVWGRYINFDRTWQNHYLEICEAAFEYDAIVDIRIQRGGTEIDGPSLSLYKGQGLLTSTDCTIENTANFSLSLTWKFNDKDVQTLLSGQKPGIYQVKENNMQRLYITKTTDSDDGNYSCLASVEMATVLSRSFTLNFRVDCMWGVWSACSGTCGVGIQSRRKAVREQYGGVCAGSSVQTCDTEQRPCRPTVSGGGVSVDEGGKAVLSCQASQFSGLSDPITFGWFKVRSRPPSLVSVRTDSKRVVSNTSHSPNGTETVFTGKLTIGNAKRSDAGDYKCKASNQHGTSAPSSSATIFVKYGPRSVTIYQRKPQQKWDAVGNSITFVKGTTIALAGSAAAYPKASYIWQLPNNTSYTGQILALGKVQFTHNGTYTCEAKNTINGHAITASRSLNLRVEGPPPKCNQPSATSYKASSITVNVSCPNGNSAITEFEIQYRKASGQWRSKKFSASISQSFISQSFIVGDLSAFTSYEVRVRAANKYNYEKNKASFSDLIGVRTAEGVPTPPDRLYAVTNGSQWIVVAWSPPRSPNGEIHHYLLYVQAQSLLQRKIYVDGTVHTSNVTMLNPFSNYSIQVSAVTIRRHDGKALVGKNSSVSYFTTKEDVPSEPHDLRYVVQPPSQVNLSWAAPLTPNGIIRHYRIQYWRQDGRGTVAVVHPVERLSYSLNLAASTVYNVSVEAYTVGYGPASSVRVASHAITPSPPRNVIVSELTFSSLKVTWAGPQNPNGDLRFYKVHYEASSSGQSFDVCENIPATKNSHSITKLNPYTNYTVYVTVINNAENFPESKASNIVQTRTLAAPPDNPPPPILQNGQLIAPDISDSNGPIKFIDIIIYHGSMDDSAPSEREIPKDIESYKNNSDWYITRYTWQEYESDIAGNPVSIEDVLAIVGGEKQSTVKATPDYADYAYYVYIRVVALDNSGGNISVVSEAARYIVPEASTSGSGSTPAIVAVVVVVLVILLIIIIIVIVVKKWRKNRRESSASTGSSVFGFFTKKQQSDNGYGIKESSIDEPDSPVKSSEFLSITSYEGTTVILPCDATGDTKPKIQWFFDDTLLPGGGSRFVVLGDGALQISGVKHSDGGMYRCTATSDDGTNKQTVELIVHNRDKAEKQLNLWELTESIPKLQRKQSKAGLHAIGKHEFPDFVASMRKDDNVGFFAEFQTLDSTHCDLPATAAQANLHLNRYKNILTYDHARVVLPALEGMPDHYGDYIAAAYVDGYRRPKKYIASQGPQQKTVIDSWRMIWAENVPTIVMLTHLTEGNKVKCHQYWPKNNGETMNYDGLLVTLIETDSFSDHAIRKFTVTLNAEIRRVKQYHFTSWPDHGVPKFATGLLGFIRRINREHPQNKGPMMVHCSAGVGRTGTFIVIDTMMEKLEDHQPIDIYNCVASLRTKRQEMVQSEIQYTFIHDAVLEALVCGNTEIPIQSLRIAISKLSKPDLKTKKRAYDRHFDVLETTGQKMEKRLCRAGQQTTVAGKNRYKSIIPLDTQRVILRLEDTGPDGTYINAEAGSDYINASYLDGYHRRDAFITTQGPLAKTVNDFWKMIWQQNSLSIVMLTSLEEDGEEMCCQYWPTSGSSQYGQYTVSLQNKNNDREYVNRTLTVSKGAETRTVGQFHYTQWPNKGAPQTISQLLNMMEQLQRWQQSTGNTVITVHCNNGVGRTGVFCVLLSLIEQMKVENVVDVFLKVRSMRIQNPLSVQTVGQYKLIYDSVLAYMDGFSTYANFK